MSHCRIQYIIAGTATQRQGQVGPGLTVKGVIDTIARREGADVNQMSLGDSLLDPDEPFYSYYESRNQLFVLSKAASGPVNMPPALGLRRLELPCVLEKRTVKQKVKRRIFGSRQVSAEVLAAQHPLSGVIAHLSVVCGGNVDDYGLVRVTASDIRGRDPRFGPRNAADLWSDSFFHSGAGQDQWICYDFGDAAITPRHYSIGAPRRNRPRSWVLEGSNDGESWVQLDRRERNKDLEKKKGGVCAFDVAMSTEVRQIRLRRSGELVITSFEIFGSLVRSIVVREFSPALTEGRLRHGDNSETEETYEIPDGIIAYLTRQCRGNVHRRGVVNVASSKSVGDWWAAARNVADLADDSIFCSDGCNRRESVPHERNNWISYDFRGRRVVPTHYALRTNGGAHGEAHLRSWIAETSDDQENWREVDRKDGNEDLDAKGLTRTFAMANAGECRFIRLTNIGRTHWGCDCLSISAWEIFGTLIE
jgi:hypothetical protein